MIEKNDATNGSEEIESGLLLKYIKGVSTNAENTLVVTWLNADSGNEKILLQTAYIYYIEQTQNRIRARNPEAALDKIHRRIRKKRHRLFMQRFLAVAGCVLLLVSVGVNSYFWMQKNDEVQHVTMQTNAGMRTNVSLPDGTEVHLNSVTKLTYPISFTKKERRVVLEGEAYFKVNQEAGRPFVVALSGKSLEVEVLGTEFNMQAYADDSLLKITLVEGAVRLGFEGKSGDLQYTTLKPSQRAVYDMANRNMQIRHVDITYDIAWIHGRLMFKDMPVPEVLGRLSRFYNVHFQVEDVLIDKYTFTGTFENKQLSQVLDYLSIASNIKYKIVTPIEDDSESLKRTSVILTKK